MQSEFNSGLPYLCSPRDIYESFFDRKLGINAVYDLFHQPTFPRVIVGRKFFVTRPAFLDWWNRQQSGGYPVSGVTKCE